jgi:hypothetical protein
VEIRHVVAFARNHCKWRFVIRIFEIFDGQSATLSFGRGATGNGFATLSHQALLTAMPNRLEMT